MERHPHGIIGLNFFFKAYRSHACLHCASVANLSTAAATTPDAVVKQRKLAIIVDANKKEKVNKLRVDAFGRQAWRGWGFFLGVKIIINAGSPNPDVGAPIIFVFFRCLGAIFGSNFWAVFGPEIAQIWARGFNFWCQFWVHFWFQKQAPFFQPSNVKTIKRTIFGSNFGYQKWAQNWNQK